tara:strand:+ start:415 stop:639 length:225 start_codon:yes stop_codon:yes gene_type:complete
MSEGKHTSYWVDMKNELELSIEDLTLKSKEMQNTIKQAKAIIRQQRLNQAFNDKFLKDNDLWDKYVSIRTKDTT